MPTFGLKLMCELRGPSELVAQAVAAEQRGLDFVAISDHLHPWLGDHHHSPFAWSVLGAIAERTERVQIITGVTCPTTRYHPLVIAQAAATIGVMSGGRFTLGVGAGERLNEHATGAPFGSVADRHERLEEAIDVMRLLWEGGFVRHRGRHYTVDDARIYDLPAEPVPVVVAVSGDESLDLACRVGASGIMATEPDASLVDGWVQRGGDGRRSWTEVPIAWARSDEEGLALAHERFRFGALGWKVMAELPNPVNFDAAAEHVTAEAVGASVPYGPDPQRAIDAIVAFLDAGFEHVSIVPVGDDLDATLDFWSSEVLPGVLERTAVSGRT